MNSGMTITKKLLGLSAISAVLTLGVGFMGYWGINSTSKGTQEVLGHEAQINEHSSGTLIGMLQLRRFEKDLFLNIGDKKKEEEYEKKFQGHKEETLKNIDMLKKLVTKAEDKERLSRVLANMDKYVKGMAGVTATIKSGEIKNGAEGNKALGEYKEAIHQLETDVDHLAEQQDMDKLQQVLLEAAKRAEWIMIAIMFLAIAVGLVLSVLLARTITSPVKKAVAILDSVAAGDFTKRLDINSKDEIGQMALSLNKSMEALSSAFISIANSSTALASSSEELTAVSHQMSSNSEETAAQANVVSAASEQVSKNVQTVAAGAEEMGASIKEIAKNTNEAARVAKEAVQVAEKTNATIAKLGTSSAEIGNVIKVITSIAEQTNLLALNATIEAARAGEAGKGFAVVANEVKELAKQTGDATEDISNKIGAIQQDTQGAVAAIQQISGIINQVNDIANTIASAVEEQSVTTNEMSRNVTEASKGSNEIVQNITGVAQAAQSTASGATETQAAAEELARLANELQSAVNQFKYDDGAQAGRPPQSKHKMPAAARAPMAEKRTPSAQSYANGGARRIIDLHTEA